MRLELVRAIKRASKRDLFNPLNQGGTDLADDVRALFSANGGDFTGTMLDFTDSTALWRDTGATTQAGDGDTLARVDDQSGEGNNATQATVAERPSVTTDAFGTLVASPDGADDNMELPDGVLGDGTDHVHIFSAYAIDLSSSEAGAAICKGDGGSTTYGMAVNHSNSTGKIQTAQSDGSSTNTALYQYDRALTSSETVVRADLFAPNTSIKARLNGAEVINDPGAYTTFDDPGAPTILGDGVSQNIAGTCHAIVVLTGSRAMTAAEITTVEAWLASLTGDTLLTAEADTVLQRLFTPATDLNVSEDFSTYTNTAEAEAEGWVFTAGGDGSAGIAGGELELVSGSAGERSSAERSFQTRVGYQYTISFTQTAGAAVIFKVGTTEGGGDVANSFSDSHTFVAQSSVTWITLLGTNSASATQSFSDSASTEIAATGEWWDLLDTTKLLQNTGGDAVAANDSIFAALARGNYDGESLGDETVTNGDFGTGDLTNWTNLNGAGDTQVFAFVDGGIYIRGKNTGIQAVNDTALDVQAGSLCRLTVDLLDEDGTATISIGSDPTDAGVDAQIVAPSLAIGSNTVYFVSSLTNPYLFLRASGATGNFGNFDNVSVKKVLGHPLVQSTAGSRPALDATGTFIEFDGVDDYFEAVDPDDDLAIVGDVTIISAVNRDGTPPAVIVGAGDPVSTTDDLAFAQYTSFSTVVVRRADATASEEKAFGAGLGTGVDHVLSAVFDGTQVVQAADVDAPQTDTFSTVTTPTAGSAPIFTLGANVNGGAGAAFDGPIKQLLIADRALSTGLLLHMERAITEKIQ